MISKRVIYRTIAAVAAGITAALISSATVETNGLRGDVSGCICGNYRSGHNPNQ